MIIKLSELFSSPGLFEQLCLLFTSSLFSYYLLPSLLSASTLLSSDIHKCYQETAIFTARLLCQLVTVTDFNYHNSFPSIAFIRLPLYHMVVHFYHVRHDWAQQLWHNNTFYYTQFCRIKGCGGAAVRGAPPPPPTNNFRKT